MEDIKEKFEKFYTIFLNSNKNELDKLEEYRQDTINERKKRNIILFIIEMIALLFFIYGIISGTENISMFGFMIAIFGPMIIALCIKKNIVKYENIYKDVVIKKIIEYFEPSLKYYPDANIDYSEYNEIGLEHCNEFHSTDVIKGIYLTDQVTISKVITQYSYRDFSSTTGGGNYETFEGVFAEIKLSDRFNENIYIKRKTEISEKLFSVFVKDINQVANTRTREQQLDKECKKIYIDKLSKEFIIYTSNLKYENIFDNSLIRNLIDISNKQKFEISIKNGNIYIKLWVDGAFSAPPPKDEALSKEYIYKNFEILYMIFYLFSEFKMRLMKFDKF